MSKNIGEKVIFTHKHKKMIAAMNTVRSLSNRGKQYHLLSTTRSYIITCKRGRQNPFNMLLQTFYNWLISHDITLQVTWLLSEKCLADPISRWEQNRGDFTLDNTLFKKLQTYYKAYIILETDLFASPGKKN